MWLSQRLEADIYAPQDLVGNGFASQRLLKELK